MLILSKSLPLLSNLKTLEISVNQTAISDDGLRAVFKSISGLSNLESISFGLSQLRINKIDTIDILGSSL